MSKIEEHKDGARTSHVLTQGVHGEFSVDFKDVPHSDQKSKSPSVEEANYKKRLKLFK